MQTLFISDLHLGHQNPQVAKGFIDFLQGTARGADRLFILGDFFDAWIGDDEDSPAAAAIKAALRDYAQNHATYFMHGNRDFLIGERFATETGVELLAEQTVIDLSGRRALLMHGDSLCTRDTEYMQFRAMVRNPAWQQQVLALPLPQRRQMAADLRSKSLSMNAIKADDIMDVTPEEVARVMTQHDVDLLIHGHTHRPAQHQFSLQGKAAERWVLGDWHDTGWYLRAADDNLSLHEFAIA